MTKVQQHFRLQRPLDEPMMEQIAAANSLYGIDRLQISANREEIMVEYDASRLRVPELEATLQRAGIPIASVYAAN